MSNVYCTYYATDVSRGQEGSAYRERMDERGNVVPLLPDNVAYVTLSDDGSFVIRSDTDELLVVGQSERQMQRELSLLKPKETLINSVEIEEYYRQKAKENDENGA